jgi:hypothetical protein
VVARVGQTAGAGTDIDRDCAHVPLGGDLTVGSNDFEGGMRVVRGSFVVVDALAEVGSVERRVSLTARMAGAGGCFVNTNCAGNGNWGTSRTMGAIRRLGRKLELLRRLLSLCPWFVVIWSCAGQPKGR